MTGVPNATAGTGAIAPPSQPHAWAAPRNLDPNEVPRCRECGSRDRSAHIRIPSPRRVERQEA